MSQSPKALAADPVLELAAKIYIELICRHVAITDSAVQMKSKPENLAKLSFEFAEAFQRVTVEQNRRDAPKNEGFDVQGIDLASWGTPKP